MAAVLPRPSASASLSLSDPSISAIDSVASASSSTTAAAAAATTLAVAAAAAVTVEVLAVEAASATATATAAAAVVACALSSDQDHDRVVEVVRPDSCCCCCCHEESDTGRQTSGTDTSTGVDSDTSTTTDDQEYGQQQASSSSPASSSFEDTPRSPWQSDPQSSSSLKPSRPGSSLNQTVSQAYQQQQQEQQQPCCSSKMTLLYPSASSGYVPPSANSMHNVESGIKSQQRFEQQQDKENNAPVSSASSSLSSLFNKAAAATMNNATLSPSNSPNYSSTCSSPQSHSPSTSSTTTSNNLKPRSRRSSAAHPRSTSGRANNTSLSSQGGSSSSLSSSSSQRSRPGLSAAIVNDDESEMQTASTSNLTSCSTSSSSTATNLSTSPRSVASPAASITPRGMASPPSRTSDHSFTDRNNKSARQLSYDEEKDVKMMTTNSNTTVDSDLEEDAAKRYTDDTVASVTAALERAAGVVFVDEEDEEEEVDVDVDVVDEDGYAGGADNDGIEEATRRQRPKRERTSTDGSTSGASRPRSRRSSTNAKNYRGAAGAGGDEFDQDGGNSSSSTPPRTFSENKISSTSNSGQLTSASAAASASSAASSRSRRSSASTKRLSRRPSGGGGAGAAKTAAEGFAARKPSFDGLDLGASLQSDICLDADLLEAELKFQQSSATLQASDARAELAHQSFQHHHHRHPHQNPEQHSYEVESKMNNDEEAAFDSWDTPSPPSFDSRMNSSYSSLLPPIHIRDFAFKSADPRYLGQPLASSLITLPDDDQGGNAYGREWMSPNSLHGHQGSLHHIASGPQPSPSLSMMSNSSSSSLSSNFTPPPFGAFGTNHSFNYTGYRTKEGTSPNSQQQQQQLQNQQQQLAMPKDGQWSNWGISSKLSNGSDHSSSAGQIIDSSTPMPGRLWSDPSPPSDQDSVSDSGTAGANLLDSTLTIHMLDPSFDDDDDDDDDLVDGPFAIDQGHGLLQDPAVIEQREQLSQESFSKIPSGGLLYRAKYTFAAETESEMHVVEGDIVRIWQQLCDGWVLGARVNRTAASAHHSNPANELELATGIVPQTYLVLAQDLPSES